jgi:hypothetical protein
MDGSSIFPTIGLLDHPAIERCGPRVRRRRAPSDRTGLDRSIDRSGDRNRGGWWVVRRLPAVAGQIEPGLARRAQTSGGRRRVLLATSRRSSSSSSSSSSARRRNVCDDERRRRRRRRVDHLPLACRRCIGGSSRPYRPTSERTQQSTKREWNERNVHPVGVRCHSSSSSSSYNC